MYVNCSFCGSRGAILYLPRASLRVLRIGHAADDTMYRNWISKIEGDLQSGHVYFVVVGAAHIGGPNGVLALLRTRGYQIEQL